MARIRTVKPEFWEDETVGILPRDARLLFVATWNLADDEGLLRWTAAYIKASVFMYDDDLDLAAVEALMSNLVDRGIVFPYKGGATQQRLAYVVNFHKHQRINRPSPSKLPPPSLQNRAVQAMYGRRDGMICHLCKGEINPVDVNTTHGQDPRLHLSLDHKKPRVAGGSDYPSNIAASHVSCNKSRKDSPLVDDPDSVNDSVSGSRQEGSREQGKEGEGKRAPAHASAPPADSPPPVGVTAQAAQLVTEHPHPPDRWTEHEEYQLRRQAATLLGSAIPALHVGEGLRRLADRPGAGPGLLPHLVHDAVRGKPAPVRRKRHDPNAGIYRHTADEPATTTATVTTLEEWMSESA